MKHFSRLMDYLPQHFENRTTNEILKMQEIELALLYVAFENVINQFCVETSDSMLENWSKINGIDDDSNIDLDTRRSNNIAEMRRRDITTNKVVRSMSEAYSGGECVVIEHFDKYAFTIKFIGTYGVPKRIDELKKAIDRVIPAHLSYDFIYRFMIWDEFDGYDHMWDEWDAKNLTWDEFDNYHEKTGNESIFDY